MSKYNFHGYKAKEQFLFLVVLLGVSLCAWPLSSKPIPDHLTRLETVSSGQSDSLMAGFVDPPRTARPQAWWWWLRTTTNEAAITKDLEAMKAKGLSGCLILDGGVAGFGPKKWKQKTIIDTTEIRYEATDEYQGGSFAQAPKGPTLWSKPWRDWVRFAAKEADRLDLDLGVFIGPAGCGGPWVTPENGQQELVWSKTICQGPARFDQMLPQPGKPDRGYYRDVFLLAVPVGNRVPADKVLDLTGKMDITGHLQWDIPAGQWTLYRFGQQPTGRNLYGEFYIDHLSAEIFDRHWEHTVGLLLKEMSPAERRAFKYIECDSWEAGLPNWTQRFPEEFEQRRGYSLRRYLPALAGRTIDSEARSAAFRRDYRLTISDLISENHYGRQRQVANRHGLDSYAEAAGPHQFQADLLKCVGNCDMAMGEFWMPSPHRPQPEARFMVRKAASAAHIYGMKRVFAESFTSVGPNWEVGPFQMKAAADQAFCDGLNWICFHTFTHRPSVDEVPGLTHSAGTHFDRTLTWWNQAGAFVDYLSRCSFMLQQGLFVADVLYYQGDGIRMGDNGKPLASAFVWKDGLKNPRPSLGTGYDYDQCNTEVLMTRMKIQDGKLTLPDGMSYQLLVLPEIWHGSVPLLRQLLSFSQAGATILGPAPQARAGLLDDPGEYKRLVEQLWSHQNGRQTAFIENKPERAVLQQHGIGPDFICTGLSEHGMIDFIHRRDGGTDIYYVASRWQPVEDVLCRFRTSGRQPELWDSVTGQRRDLTDFQQDDKYTTIPLRFEPCESYFVVFRKPLGESVKHGKNWTRVETMQTLSGPWQVHFDPDWGGPASVTFTELIDWSEHKDPAIRYYSGNATYSGHFNLAQTTAERLFLDLGRVYEVAAVRLNGHDLGVLWNRPLRVEINDFVKTGENKLDIDIVNLWPNRLIGDSLLPEHKRYTQTNMRKFTPKTKLLPSGLIGPVVLQREKGN